MRLLLPWGIGNGVFAVAAHDIIIEFIGLPGAGKSTVAAALAARMAADFDVACPERAAYRTRSLTLLEKLHLDAWYAPDFLGWRLSRVLHDIRRSGPGIWTITNSWDRSRYPLVLLDLARRTPGRVQVLDEWLLHRTIDESIRRYGGSIDYACRYAISPVPGYRRLFVCVNIQPDRAARRILNEDQPFRRFARDRDPQRIDTVLAQWQAQLQALKREIARRDLLLLEIDGEAPVEHSVETVRDRLVALAHATEFQPASSPTGIRA